MTTATSPPLRVLQLGSPSGLYGAERWILALLRHLEPSVVTSLVGSIKDAPGPEPEICQRARMLALETRVFEAPGRLSLPAAHQIRSFIRSARIDILHTHGYKTDLLGLLAVRGTGCRIISTPHGWSVRAGLKMQAYEALDRAIFPFFDAVAPLSADLHEGLKRLPGVRRKLHLIPNGVDLSEVEAARAPPPGSEAAVPAGHVIIGYIGQLIARKRLDTLIEAFARLSAPRKHLCIIGDGPQREDLERIAAGAGLGQSVSFCGYREDRLSLLKAFDVFVLPSELEGIPRCLMESMAAAVPTVATDIPGCRDILQHEKNGLLFTPGDTGALLACLERLCADRSLALALGSAGRSFVNEKYSATAMARAYTELFRAVAPRTRIAAA